MKKTVFAFLAIALIAFAAAAGCVSTPAEEDQSPVGEWMNEGKYYISLNPDGTVLASGENYYPGTYTVNESGIVIDAAPVITMAVPEEEATFVGTLTSATGYRIENGDLVLTAEGNDVLTFKPIIIGTWETKDGISLTFGHLTIYRYSPFSVTVGANTIFGTSQYTENGITFSMPESGSTLALGTEDETAKEQALIDTLGAVRNYFIINDKLTLVDANGKELLILTATPVGAWGNEDVTILLEENGTATIIVDNTYTAFYDYDGETIAFKDIMQITNMIPTEKDKEFLAAFESAGNTLEAGQFLTAHSLPSDDEPSKVVLYFYHR